MGTIRKMLDARSASTPRFLFELCGGRWVMLAAVSWFMVELAREAPVVPAQGADRVVESVRRGKR